MSLRQSGEAAGYLQDSLFMERHYWVFIDTAARASLSTDYTAVGAAPGATVSMMKQQLAHFTVGAVEPITLNGLSGYRIRYSWTGGSAETYMLYKLLGHTPRSYTLTVTVSDKARPAYRQALDAALRSFVVTR